MEYYSHLWTGASEYQLNPLGYIQLRAVRVVDDPKLTDGFEPNQAYFLLAKIEDFTIQRMRLLSMFLANAAFEWAIATGQAQASTRGD